MSEPSADTGIARPRQDLAAFRDRPLVEQLLLLVITIGGIGLTLGTIYFAYSRVLERAEFAVLFFGVGAALYYLVRALRKIESPGDVSGPSVLTRRLSDSVLAYLRLADAVVCVVLAAAAAASGYYVFTNFIRLSENAIVLGFEQLDIYVGLLIVFLTIDTTRRAYGWSIALVAVASVVYAFFGDLMPGPLQHAGFSIEDIATFGAMRITGAFHFIMEVGATWVAIFIMFAGLARAYGALDFILEVGQKLGSNLNSGVVHVAVVSSMAMGSITGSAAANTATTGSFTIPMMKRQGVRKDFAAAIESVASAGGQIMPPIMGVAAFLMADILGVSYVRVIQAGFIPALLFYFSVGIAVQFVVLRHGWTVEQVGDGSLVRKLFSPGTLVSVIYAALGAITFTIARGLAETVTVGGTTLFVVPTLDLTPLRAAAVTVGVLLGARYVHALVVRLSPVDAARDLVRSLRDFMDGGHFGVPMLVLVYTLVVMRLSPMSAGLYTIITLVATMLVRDLFVHVPDRGHPAEGPGATPDEDGGYLRKLVNWARQRAPSALIWAGSILVNWARQGVDWARQRAPSALIWTGSILVRTVTVLVRTGYTTFKGFRQGAVDMAPLVGVLAAMGLIISMVTQTGLTGQISTTMVALGGGILLFVLILAMVTSILFGLGMPTPAAYILVATLLVQPVVELGVVRITAHLFVFYFAMLSAITPPVAVGVAVGSRIADSSFMQTALQALRIGAAGFLIPYALVINDSLVNWTPTGTPFAVYCVFVGVVALTAVTIGYDGRHVLGLAHRASYFVLATVAMYAPAIGIYVGPTVASTLQVAAATVALAGLVLTNTGRLPRAVAPAGGTGKVE